MPDVAAHSEPVGRDSADFLIHVDLSMFGMPGKLEQLWVKELGDDRYEVCCVPFFTYGIALHDVVTATSDQSDHISFREVVKQGDHRVLRFAFHNKRSAAEHHELLHQRLSTAELRHEWLAQGYGAIDIGHDEEERAAREILNGFPLHVEIA